MDDQQNTNRDRLKELYTYYNLVKQDIFKHEKFGYIMIKREGIEKIMAHDKIKLSYKVIAHEFGVGCVVEATAEVEREGEMVKISTLGSATKENCQLKYYPETAEKRSKVRAVLMITEFYQLGVKSDDESDDFKQR